MNQALFQSAAETISTGDDGESLKALRTIASELGYTLVDEPRGEAVASIEALQVPLCISQVRLDCVRILKEAARIGRELQGTYIALEEEVLWPIEYSHDLLAHVVNATIQYDRRALVEVLPYLAARKETANQIRTSGIHTLHETMRKHYEHFSDEEVNEQYWKHAVVYQMASASESSLDFKNERDEQAA